LHGLSTARLKIVSAITTNYDARFNIYRNEKLSKDIVISFDIRIYY